MREMVFSNTKSSAKEDVYQALRHDILHLELTPGTKISEKEISDKFQVSRTPVREVFVRLAQEELLDIYPQRGSFVSLIDLDHIDEARFVRENLEKAVIREACQSIWEEKLHYLRSNLATQEVCRENRNYKHMLQLDDGFHQMIYEAAGKIRTWRVIEQFNTDFYRLRMLRLTHDFQWEKILTQHWDIFKSLTDRDGDRGMQIVEDHLQLVSIEKGELLSSWPEYFAHKS